MDKAQRLKQRQLAVALLCVMATALALGGCGNSELTEATRTLPLAQVGTTARPTLPAGVPTALPSDLEVVWGEWWYEGEYLASEQKYPGDAEYHEQSFNIRVTIRNTSNQTLPGTVVPLFYLTNGEEERAVITWYYSPEDLRPLGPREKKEAVFRTLTYAPGEWIQRGEIRWRGQTWSVEFPKR